MSIEESAMHRSGYRSGHRSGLGELSLPARRSFLRDVGQGFGGLALAALLGGESRAAVSALPHHAPRAKRVIWLFMTGAPSQMDTWDYKPELQARHGQPLPGADKQVGFFGTSGSCMASPFKWAQHGESGSWVSELFPHLSRHVDRMTFIHSCHVRANNHAPASMELMSGFSRPGMPSMGAWLDYGLGSLADDLPSFVVMHDAARPRGDDQIWSPGFLPRSHQAIALSPELRIADLARRSGVTAERQREDLDVLAALNAAHAADRPAQADLAARLASFELAYRMQVAAPEAFDLSQEPKHIHDLYGTADKRCGVMARQCLTARRLLERGTRFIQIFAGRSSGDGDGSRPDVPWDGHNNIEANHTACAASTDQPAAALLADLEARGLLDDTLVIWGGEFGRTSDSQGGKGRDHNPNGFTIWMAGGGVKGGFHYGATDPFGYKAVEKKVGVNDLHATILHLLGIDHERLTYRHNGRDFRLTDVGGTVIRDVIA
jgi:hypothetical protein